MRNEQAPKQNDTVKRLFIILFIANFGILIWLIFTHELNHDSIVHISHARRFLHSEYKLFSIYPLMHVLPAAIAFLSSEYAGVMVTLILFSFLYVFGMKILADQLRMTLNERRVLLCLATALILPYEIDYMNSAVALLFPLYLALFFKVVQNPSSKVAIATLVIISAISVTFHPQFLQAVVIFLVVAALAYRNKEVSLLSGMVAGLAFICCLFWVSQWGLASYPYLFIKDHIDALKSGGLVDLFQRAGTMLTDGNAAAPLAKTFLYQVKTLGGILLVCLFASPVIRLKDRALKSLFWTAVIFGLLYTAYFFRMTFWLNTEQMMMRMLCFIPVVGLPLASANISKLKMPCQVATILALAGLGIWRIMF